MNVTSEDIARAMAPMFENPSLEQYNATKERFRLQMADEMSLIRQKSCHMYADERPFVDSDLVAQNVSQQPYNQDVLNSTGCILNSLAYLDPGDIPNKPWIANYRLRKYFRDIRQIGTPSVNGYAMLTPLEDGPHRTGLERTPAKDLFIVKVGQDPARDELTHEVAVGILGTNRLRQIPNFSYVYGAFGCSPAFLIEGSKEPVGWCTANDNKVTFAVYENVAPAISLRDYIKTCTGAQFLNVFTQVLLALRFAFIQCEFTHYDLHDENVLVRGLPQNTGGRVTLDYSVPGDQSIFLEVDRIATFIDYGRSFFRYNGKGYGYPGMEKSGTYPDRGYPLFDAYKLLMFSGLNAMKFRNNEVYTVCAHLFYFFNKTDDFGYAVNAQAKYFFNLPFDHRYTIDELITFASQTFGDIGLRDTPDGLAAVFECGSYGPYAVCRKDTMLVSRNITNLLDFHDAYHGKVRNPQDFQNLVGLTDWQTLVNASSSDLNKYESNAQMYLTKLRSLGQISVANESQLKTFYQSLLGLMDALINYVWEYSLGARILAVTNNALLRQLTTNAAGRWTSLREQVEPFYRLLLELDVQVEAFTRSAAIKSVKDPRWYLDTSVYITQSISLMHVEMDTVK